jgi:hypothetical protein
MVATRTPVVKNLDEGYLYAVRANTPSIVAARSVGQRIVATGASTIATPLTEAVRGAGYAGSSGAVSAFAVALKSVDAATVITIGAETATFAIGDPPGTAVPFTGAIDIQAVPTIASAVAGNMFAIVEQPPAYSAGRIDYVQSKSHEPAELSRDIRDKGSLTHRKKTIAENGVLSIGSFYENNQAGLSGFAGQDIILVLERDDDRQGVVTEKEIYYGARINVAPPLNESAGDTDTDTTLSISYELMAIVGES